VDFADVVEDRHSIRAFERREVEPAELEKVLRAARRAPSAGNLQAYRVAVIQAEPARRKLAHAAFGQDFVAQAPTVLVFLADAEASGAKYGGRGETLFAVQDATIACAYAQLAACNAGLGAVWVGAFVEDQVRTLLGVDEHLRPVALLPLGYSAEIPEIRPRRPLSEMVLDGDHDA
jgi:nitroreductase